MKILRQTVEGAVLSDATEAELAALRQGEESRQLMFAFRQLVESDKVSARMVEDIVRIVVFREPIESEGLQRMIDFVTNRQTLRQQYLLMKERKPHGTGS